MAGTWSEQTGAAQASTFAVAGIAPGDIILSAVALAPPAAPVVLTSGQITIPSAGQCQTPFLNTSAMQVLINWDTQPATDFPSQPWANLPDPLTPATLRVYMIKGLTPSIVGTLDDSQLQSFIDTAAARMETECDRFIVARTATIQFPATHQHYQCKVRCFRAGAAPIQSITDLRLLLPDGSAIIIPQRPTQPDPPTPPIPAWGWWRRSDLDRRGIFMCDTPRELHHACFDDRDAFAWQVTGTFGFDPVVNQREMSDLAECIKLWATDTWAVRVPSATAVEAGGMTMSVSTNSINAKVRGILDKYRLAQAV